jgi:spermidine synthase
MKSFYEIGLNQPDKTDKVSYHRYDRFYPLFLESLRDQEFNMLEIGVGSGGSLRLWEEYFPKASIHGVDVDYNYFEGSSERFTLHKFDQSNPNDLKEIVNTLPKCKFIIDDGSHHPHHQFTTFIELFKNLLEPEGVYIIEDIECNYWHPDSTIYGYEIGYFNILSYFKNTLDQINTEFSDKKNYLNISTVTFAHNCIIITKQTPEETEISNKPYRAKQYQ